MIKKTSASSKVFDFFNIALFLLFSLSIIYPFLRIITYSFSDDSGIFKEGLHLFPRQLFFRNWEIVIASKMVWTSFRVTIFVVIFACLYQLLLTTMFAYPLSNRNLPNRNFWTLVIVFTMYFSGGLIPTYLLYKSLGLINSVTALILGGISGWYTLIIRNFFMTVPDSIKESAQIDGANEVTIFYKLILPLSMPVLATVILWNLVGSWNSWVPCMIYITDPDKQVLQVVLRRIIIQNSVDISSINTINSSLIDIKQQKHPSSEGMKAAMLLFVTVPILLVYPFLQKYFVKGILVGSLKG